MDAKNNNTDQYLKTRVMTASPEQLQLMLYDGAIRFCEQARVAVEAKEIENSYNLLSRAEKIVLELASSMRDDMAPDVCANMRGLYMFCYERLVQANLKKEIEPIDEALQVLNHMRQTWLMLIEKLKEEKSQQIDPDSQDAKPQDPVAQQIGATISIEG